MKKLLLIFVGFSLCQKSLDANFFSNAFDKVKNAVEGAAGKISGSSSTINKQIQADQQAIKQLEFMVTQYQTAIQQGQVQLQQDAATIQQDENEIAQCEIEKALYLQLLPHAPPANDPITYQLLALITLMAILDPLESADNYTQIRSAFTIDEFTNLAKTLSPFSDAELQKLQSQYLMPNGTPQCNVSQLASSFISGLNVSPLSSYLITSATSATGFGNWAGNLNTPFWQGTGQCNALGASVYPAILPQITARLCNTTNLGQEFLRQWKALKPGAPNQSYLQNAAASVTGFQGWASNLSVDWWYGSTFCSPDSSAIAYNEIQSQLH